MSAPTAEDIKKAFSARLQKLIDKAGWSAAELARKATDKGKKLKPAVEVTRDNAYRYLNAVAIPGPERLTLICDALGVAPDDLLPSRPKRGQNSPFQMRDVGNGKAHIVIDREVSWEIATKIVTLLQTGGA